MNVQNWKGVNTLTDAELQQYKATLGQARTLVDWLIAALSDYKVQGTLRSRVTIACFGLTQEHHHAIVNLLEANLKSSASALVRSVFESYVRGLWLSHCATDAQVEAYSTGKEPPNMADLIAAIEKTEIYPDGELSRIKAQAWGTMNQYTHSGGLQVQRWNTGDFITPNHSIDEMQEVLEFVNALVLLSAVSIAGSVGDEALAERLVEKAKEIAPNQPTKS